MQIDREKGRYAIYGGLLLGGGGGGSLSAGLEVLELALSCGDLVLHPIEEFPEEALIATAALVGSPASREKYVEKNHYEKVYELFTARCPQPLAGLISNEVGAQAITNGWVAAAEYGLPLIDAPCNGRAHPTGAMGSMGLSALPDYISLQAAAGGRGEKNLSLTVEASLTACAGMLSAASVAAGGFVTVLRNPVPVSYVRRNAALGAYAQTMTLGRILMENSGDTEALLHGLRQAVGLVELDRGRITSVYLETKDGLDRGLARLEGQSEVFEVSIWNEYMTAEGSKSGRIATFPDLIALIDCRRGLPLISAELCIGQEICLVKIPRERLLLGSSMFDQSLLKDAEKTLGKSLLLK